MISIIKTTYPRFKKNYTEEELAKIFEPNKKELQFCRINTRGHQQRLTLLTLLKAHQYLGYLPSTSTVPKSLRCYLSTQLGFSKELELIEPTESNKKTFYRYRKAIRRFLEVLPWSAQAITILQDTIFSTLDRMVSHLRHEVHLELYKKLNATLSLKQREALDKLLEVNEGDTQTDFSRICEKPKKPTLSFMRNWTTRLAWLKDKWIPKTS